MHLAREEGRRNHGNGGSSDVDMSAPLAFADFGVESTTITAITPPIAHLLASFSSSVFQSQAEIAGMALAVADYLAWMRKVPTARGIAPPNTGLVYLTVLEAVEARLREMREIAQTRPRAAFRDLVAGLRRELDGSQHNDSEATQAETVRVGVDMGMGMGGASTARVLCDDLAELEREFDRQSADVAEFFRTRYNACAALSEQAIDTGVARSSPSTSLGRRGSDGSGNSSSQRPR
ncbi:hypothetical protein N0V88_005495 [Collariella sp. IMI 366227]|nr:hypothetical protein N0V88_005495 [Collariella sp. IMI 366227]